MLTIGSGMVKEKPDQEIDKEWQPLWFSTGPVLSLLKRPPPTAATVYGFDGEWSSRSPLLQVRYWLWQLQGRFRLPGWI